MPNDVMPWRDRVQAALAVLRGARDGAPDGRVATGGQTRAIIDTTFPNIGIGQAALVRTANPQEYKPEGATVRMQGFSRHPVVHACIRVVADIVASVPLVVLSAKGDMETRVPESHPLQRLLDYPGPRMTARGMRARYAVDYIGYGNAFFQLERPSPGRPPVGIRSINAEAIQTVWVDSDGDARRYDYGNWAGIVVQVPVEDVLHFRELDMPGGKIKIEGAGKGKHDDVPCAGALALIGDADTWMYHEDGGKPEEDTSKPPTLKQRRLGKKSKPKEVVEWF
jgi:hypothetical protein